MSDRLYTLPDDGSVPGMPGWRWVATPGHTDGRVSLWRGSDRTLISGDAVITTRQESAYAVALQSPEMHVPPAFFTPNWHAAYLSVQRLAALGPDLIVSGHGRAFERQETPSALSTLAERLVKLAIPKSGQTVDNNEPL